MKELDVPAIAQTRSRPHLHEQPWLFAGPYGKKEGALQVGVRNVSQTDKVLPCRRHKQVQSAGGRAPTAPDHESLLAFTGTICKAVVNVGGHPIRDTEAAMIV
jgi:hypothetical protein